MYFENEVGHEMLHSIIQKLAPCKNSKQNEQDQYIFNGLPFVPLGI